MKKIICLSMMLITTFVNAQQIPVMGNVDCGMWLEAREKKLAVSLEGFSLGYVNGLVVGSLTDIWAGKGVPVSAAQLYFFMDEFCKKNPLSGIFEGSHSFADEMTNGKFSKKIKNKQVVKTLN